MEGFMFFYHIVTAHHSLKASKINSIVFLNFVFFYYFIRVSRHYQESLSSSATEAVITCAKTVFVYMVWCHNTDVVIALNTMNSSFIYLNNGVNWVSRCAWGWPVHTCTAVELAVLRIAVLMIESRKQMVPVHCFFLGLWEIIITHSSSSWDTTGHSLRRKTYSLYKRGRTRALKFKGQWNGQLQTLRVKTWECSHLLMVKITVAQIYFIQCHSKQWREFYLIEVNLRYKLWSDLVSTSKYVVVFWATCLSNTVNLPWLVLPANLTFLHLLTQSTFHRPNQKMLFLPKNPLQSLSIF